jgi:diguanylate cyclase (GGDEF)-like protein
VFTFLLAATTGASLGIAVVALIMLHLGLRRVKTAELRADEAEAEKERQIGTMLGELNTIEAKLRHQEALAGDARRRLLAAESDALTGVLGRGAWMARSQRALLDGVPFQPAAIMAGDLDGFKRVNDTHGHEVGDYVLLVVAQRILAHFGHDALVGRLGGDEFVITLRRVPRPEELATLAATIKEPISTPGPVLRVHMSVGMACVEPGESLDALLRRADRALYASKDRFRPRGIGRVRAADRSPRRRRV